MNDHGLCISLVPRLGKHPKSGGRVPFLLGYNYGGVPQWGACNPFLLFPTHFCMLLETGACVPPWLNEPPPPPTPHRLVLGVLEVVCPLWAFNQQLAYSHIIVLGANAIFLDDVILPQRPTLLP